ncbi:MAG: MFS transporter [Lewinellaceae bacterium]|nr:MFS transporter [Lewinellaceae bacterium]
MDNQTASLSGVKPRLGFWDIWNMSFGFLGIQFGFALQNANVSRIFETLGGETSNLAVYWLAAPVTGLIVQPIIGYLSDRTWHPRFGRRRPYFMVGAVLATLALFVMPNSPSLYFAIGVLWIMDSSINISMEPFRAFVGDMLPSSQRTTGFATQSFFIGVGAVVASLLPWVFTNWLGVSNVAPEGVIPPSVKWSFYAGAAMFFTAVFWTVFRTREYSPEQLAAFSENHEQENHFAAGPQTAEEFSSFGNKQIRTGAILIALGAVLVWLLSRASVEQEVYILAGGIVVFGLLQVLAGILQQGGRSQGGFVTIMNDFRTMPATMRQLAVVQFFSWFALFAMWIYTTAAVTSTVFGSNDPTTEAYNNGADWVSVCFAVYNGIAALVAFLLPVIAKRTSRKMTHIISLLLGAAGLVSIFFVENPQLLLVSMIGIGFAWASILSMPYAILTGSLPSDKMGYYMGVFNFFIVIPQIVAASILGFLLRHFFAGNAIYAMAIGGASFVIAAIFTLFVHDKDDVALQGAD